MEGEAKQFAWLRAIVMSFYSPGLYRDVARRWSGTGLGYLLLLLGLAWAPTIVELQIALVRDAQEAPFVLAQIPEIDISQGQVSTTVQTPYLIRRENGVPLAIIDLTGQYTSLDNTPAQILLTKDRLLERNARSGTKESIDLRDVRQFHLDRAKAARWFAIAERWLALLAYPTLLFFSFLYRAVEALVYALLGMAFAKLMGLALDYRALLRLAIVAVTPAIVLGTLRALGIFRAPAWSLISFLLAMTYLLFAVWANTVQEDGAAGSGGPGPEGWPPR